MVTIPEDILLLIFETYVHTLKVSPVRLLPVSREWYAIASSAPTLWTRVYIHINSIDVVPRIIQTSIADYNKEEDPKPGSLRSYLNRSCSHDGAVQLPLDIIIEWRTDINLSYSNTDSTEEHALGSHKADATKYREEMQKNCGILTELLLLALSGIYLKGCEEGCDKLRARLQEALPQISQYHNQPVAPMIQNDSLVTFPRNDAHRWKSLMINLFEVHSSCTVSCPKDSQLGILESLTLRNTNIDLSRVAVMPSLREMDLDTSSTIVVNPTLPEIDTVERLQFYAPVDPVDFTLSIPPINFERLTTLELFGANRGHRFMILQLGEIFNESNRLDVLMVEPPEFFSLFIITALIAPSFRVKTLKLSSKYLDPGWVQRSISGIEDNSPYNSPDGFKELLKGMDMAGTKVEALDATMEILIECARENSG